MASHVMLVNNFREELVQFVPSVSEYARVSKCSTVFVNQPGSLGLGHNDDWTQDWRELAYWILANETQNDGSVFSFGTWVYPGYLVGMDLTFNSYGVVYSVNSLFPTVFEKGGLGTAFVARDLLYATDINDAIKRASHPGVSSAMSYNLGSTKERRLVECEVGSGGGDNFATAEILLHNAVFHGNEFTVLNASQLPDQSTFSRQRRFDQMSPILDLDGAIGFLGDTQGEWPVYRNKIAPDDCYTEVSAMFDLLSRTLMIWTGNPARSPPELTLPIF